MSREGYYPDHIVNKGHGSLSGDLGRFFSTMKSGALGVFNTMRTRLVPLGQSTQAVVARTSNVLRNLFVCKS